MLQHLPRRQGNAKRDGCQCIARGATANRSLEGLRGSTSIGAAGTAGAKTENTPAKGWRGHVGRGWAGACLGGTHMLAP